MLTHIAGLDPIHINADYPYPATIDRNSVHHSSDHDPIIVYIHPTGIGWIAGNLEHSGIQIQLLNSKGNIVEQTTSDAQGDFRFWNIQPADYTVRYDPPDFLMIGDEEISLRNRLLSVYCTRLHSNMGDSKK